MILNSSLNQDLISTKMINSHIVNRQMQSNSSWIERCKQRMANFFQQVSKPTTIINEQGKYCSFFLNTYLY
jgi:hypothetical protein